MPDDGVARALAVFVEEARECLDLIDEALMDLKEGGERGELVGEVFRRLHTIKGSGAMFGLDDLVEFAHEIESVYDRVRKGSLELSNPILELSLCAMDRLRQMVDRIQKGEEPGECGCKELVAKFKALLKDEQPEPSDRAAKASQSDKPCPATYRIRFAPARQSFHNGINPMNIIEDLQAIGRCYTYAHPQRIPPLNEFDPELNYTDWDIILTTHRPRSEVLGVFEYFDSKTEYKVELIDSCEMNVEREQYKRLGEILVERGDISPEALREILARRKMLGEALVESKLVSQRAIDSALAEQKAVSESRSGRAAELMSSTIRVGSDKLDTLVNLVGEMVTLQTHMTQRAENFESGEAQIEPDEFTHMAESLERLCSKLHGSVMSMRMIPISTILGKLRRQVHDLGVSLGREADFTCEGADTELDKNMIESLSGPLTHIIRNCMDHGLEPAPERVAAGKPVRGSIHMVARHCGSSVVIELMDDGRGFDARRIHEKAVSMNIIQPSTPFDEKRALSYVFHPGFSTAEVVTEVSGRGVGMDVVHRGVEALGGAVEIESVPRVGSVVRLRLPLTLAIIEGLLVRIEEEHFVFPLANVEECMEMDSSIVRSENGRTLVQVREHLVPYVRLRDRFGIHGERPAIEQVVIVGTEGGRCGFVVDNVIGKNQTVIKSLSRMFSHVRGVSGATVIGNGLVALVLDAQKLYEAEEYLAGMISDGGGV